MLSFTVFSWVMIIDQLILELITVIHSVGVCLSLVVHNVSININLDEHFSTLAGSLYHAWLALVLGLLAAVVLPVRCCHI